MPGLKTNERPGTRSVLRHYRMSATKARQALDLIRGEDVDRATEILRTTRRDAAAVISKVLASAIANAVHNDGLDAEDLYVSACYADEGTTLKRWRPRARGRAARIDKRTCHITVIVSTLPDDRLARRRAAREAAGVQRSRRVAESRRRADLAGRLARRRHAHEEAAAAAAADVEEAELEDTDASAEDLVDDEMGGDLVDGDELDEDELDEGELDGDELDEDVVDEDKSGELEGEAGAADAEDEERGR